MPGFDLPVPADTPPRRSTPEYDAWMAKRAQEAASRLRGHRLHTLALARQNEAGAIVAPRASPIRCPTTPASPSTYAANRASVSPALLRSMSAPALIVNLLK